MTIANETTEIEHAAPTPPTADVGSVARLLRWLGGSALVASGATFMWQGWGHLTTFERYYSFLALVATIAAAGVFCGRRLGDAKAARTLLALATAALTVPMSQLGAMLLCLHGGAGSPMPAAFSFVVTSPVLVAIAAAITALLCFPIAYLGFAALARPLAGQLTAAAMLCNALLLVPTRAPDAMGLLLCAACAALFAFEWHVLRPSARLHNADGLIIRAILTAPLSTLVVRNLLYPWSFGFIGCVFSVTGLACFALLPAHAARPRLAGAARALGVALLLAAWLTLATGFSEVGWPGAERTLFVWLPLSPLTFVLSLFCETRGRRMRALASYWAAAVALQQLVFVGNLLASFTCVLAGGALLAMGFLRRERAPFASGALVALLGFVRHTTLAVRLVSAAPWLSFAVLGLLALIGSAYVERHRGPLLQRVTRLRAQWRSWE